MASILERLPQELFLMVADHLPTKDLASLRLTSRKLEQDLFNWFARHFFKKKQFMLSTRGLNALVGISHHPNLSTNLETVIIGLEQYGPSWPVLINNAQMQQYSQGWADQFSLVGAGLDREMLAEAFRNLPNMKVIAIRNYSTPGRHRDNSSWNSYGAPTATRETGVQLSTNSAWHGDSIEYTPKFSSRVFSMLLFAIADAGIKPPRIEVDLRTYSSGLGDVAFHIAPWGQAKVEPVLANLEALLLTVNFTPHPMHNVPQAPAPNTPVVGTSGVHLRRFLSRTNNLQHLRLNFQQRNHNEPSRDVLSWLGESTTGPDPNLLPSVTLPRLQRLDFGSLTVEPRLILRVLEKFAPTLRTVNLRRVTLRYTRLAFSDEDKPNVWRFFLSQVSAIVGLQLDSLDLGLLGQEDENGQRTFISFGEQGAKRKDTCRAIRKNAMIRLPEFIEEVHVEWPEIVVHSIDDSDENSDDDEDEDEEMGDDGDEEEEPEE
ncbi:hypothetical protein GQ43DRAFT_160399 [Delitschia confertaspora ATCC 74209]|uniref:F-box domain-containing protein n=1 Tax=Delitschia confertaspora ATCC 74209 TaxID=1513339 RepID=A0A9P4JRL5_9PLEO|nr:hypothetical protein GQ43DRAFT_160399 [Delitschia confertaspora ATCC 74209]